MSAITNELSNRLSGLFDRGTIRLLLDYLIKGGVLTGGLTLLQNFRGKVKTALVWSVIQTVFFALVLFLIDYVATRYIPESNE